MVRVPQDLGVPETGVASFECELSRPSAEVKWFKVRSHPKPLQQHLAMSSSLLCPLAAASLSGEVQGNAVGSSLLAPLSALFPGRTGRSCGRGPTVASTQRVGAVCCS